jgi:hypothetical protein
MLPPYDGTQSCATTDPEVFFPTERLKWKEKIAQAKAICSTCPLLSACRTYSKASTGLYGVWAGEWRDGSGYVTPIPMDRKVA